MLFFIKLNPEFSSQLLEEAKVTELSLFLLAAKKTAIILSFRYDSSVLTATGTLGAGIDTHFTDQNFCEG